MSTSHLPVLLEFAREAATLADVRSPEHGILRGDYKRKEVSGILWACSLCATIVEVEYKDP